MAEQVLCDRVETESVHLPAALAVGEDLAPRPCLRGRLAAKNLLGSGVHGPAAFRVACRVAGRDPPAVHEVVQYAEIEVHPDFVEGRLEPGVERLTGFCGADSLNCDAAPSSAGIPGRAFKTVDVTSLSCLGSCDIEATT